MSWDSKNWSVYKVSSVSGHTVKTKKKQKWQKRTETKGKSSSNYNSDSQSRPFVQGCSSMHPLCCCCCFLCFALFLFLFFVTDVKIYHLALSITPLDSFAIAVHGAHVIFSRIQVTSLGAPFLKDPITFRAQRQILRTKSKEKIRPSGLVFRIPRGKSDFP